MTEARQAAELTLKAAEREHEKTNIAERQAWLDYQAAYERWQELDARHRVTWRALLTAQKTLTAAWDAERKGAAA